MKSIRIIGISFFILIIISAGAFLALAYYLNSSTDDLSDEIVVFQVERGESFNRIALELEERGLIRSALFLKIYNKITGSDNLIKTGSYNIELRLSSLEIIDQLVEGKQKLVPVVIPEGLTIRKIADILSDAGISSRDAFIGAAVDGSYLKKYGIEAETLEGFLFPDTYSFQQNFPASSVVEYMVDVFFDELSEVYPDYKMLTGRQIYDKVILSSIIEKEYRVVEEAPMMASVYYNRLDQGWNLGACPTIVYIIEEELMMAHPERLTFSDLEIESAYNTYQNQGLPPAPISNSGRVALDAVFNPASTEYMFFVVKDINAGSHEFTRNLEDHVRAKQDYLINFRSK